MDRLIQRHGQAYSQFVELISESNYALNCCTLYVRGHHNFGALPASLSEDQTGHLINRIKPSSSKRMQEGMNPLLIS